MLEDGIIHHGLFSEKFDFNVSFSTCNPGQHPKGKKCEIDVKESSLVFNIMQWIFLTFNIHIIDFLLLGFYPLQMRLCISLHENLLCDILTVTRNVNFTLPSYIEINSISSLRNYYNSDGCEFFSPVTVTREVNFPLFLSILKYRLYEHPCVLLTLCRSVYVLF